MRFQDRRVYLTGGTGFIGGRVAERLVKEGAHVTALVRRLERADALRELGVTIHQGNVTDPDTLRIPQGTDLVVHAAAWVEFSIPEKRRELYWRTNVEGTRNVLEAARRADVPKAVHLSSVAAIGATSPDADADETAFRVPAEAGDEFEVAGVNPRKSAVGERAFRTLYEETKARAHEAARDAGIPVALPMPGVVLGPGGPFEPLVRAFARGRLPALPKTNAPKPWVHIDDVVDGILLSALKGEGPYLLVSENLGVTELFVRLQRILDLKEPRWRIPMGVMRAGAGAVEGFYHLRGRTPPFGRELVHTLEEPLRFTSDRARRELGWNDRFWDLVTDDVRHLAAGRDPGRR